MKKSQMSWLLLSLVFGVALCLWASHGLISMFIPKKTVTLEQYLREHGDVPLGVIEVQKGVVELVLLGEEVYLVLTPEQGRADVPAGKWRLHRWKISRKHDDGALWTATGFNRSRKSVFEMPGGGQLEAQVGEPMKLSLSASGSGRQYVFSHRLEGRAGETVELARGGAPAPLPRVRIRNGDGTYDRVFAFEYG